MMTVPPDIAMPTPLDPGREVPAEYDVFCEACGYSLIGIVGDRCPECGATYDSNDLPFARVLWLHRRRIGRVRAYWSTVRMVLTGPRRFARELCRPVRVSAADAGAFRSLTIRIASLSVALAVAGTLAVFLKKSPPTPIPAWAWAAMAGGVVLSFVSTMLFLRLATDMPTFIWRGLPSRPASELAPVHHYAAAPLALMPLAAVVTVVASSVLLSPRDADFFPVVTAAVVLVMLAVSWLVALGLMSGATDGSRPRQVALLGLYLPIHWLMMAFLVWMLTGAVILGVNLLYEKLRTL